MDFELIYRGIIIILLVGLQVTLNRILDELKKLRRRKDDSREDEVHWQ